MDTPPGHHDHAVSRKRAVAHHVSVDMPDCICVIPGEAELLLRHLGQDILDLLAGAVEED